MMLLIEKLKDYVSSNYYPFHMPGHKRQIDRELLKDFPNPFTIDITEIDGFDNLHHATGILERSMEWASSIYNSHKTYYLVNGSSCGILSAIFSSTTFGGKIIMSRNCHKSAYHGVILNHLESVYVYPQIITELGLQGGIMANDIEDLLEKDGNIQAVIIVSPTYEGVVSDISSIAEVTHKYNIPLIVDEAHGAHFPFNNYFPDSALDLGADIVIQSVHKTLPSLTQTALLHVSEKYLNTNRLEWYLQVFQSSSPSYIFISSIEQCIFYMNQKKAELNKFVRNIRHMRKQLSQLKHIKLMDRHLIGRYGIFDIDESKIVISTLETNINGKNLGDILREKYQLELELSGPEHVIALTSIMDSEKGIRRLIEALKEIDRGLNAKTIKEKKCWIDSCPKKLMDIYEGMKSTGNKKLIKDCSGDISCEFVYLYPPGIPIIVPGERLDREIVNLIEDYRVRGLTIQGLQDKEAKYILCK